MKQSKYLRPLIGVLALLFLALVAVVALYLDSLSPDPIFGVFPNISIKGEEDPVPTLPATTAATRPSTPPDLPPVVDVPSDGHSIVLPYRLPGYGLTLHRLAPYSGMYVEQGSNVTVQNVAMLLVSNDGDFPIERTEIMVEYATETLWFEISALPVGEKLVVQEKTGKAIPEDNPLAASAMVVQRADLEMSEDLVKVTDNGDNTLTITNLTDTTIPSVRVFYKYYMEDEDVFVGGIAFTIKITRLHAGDSVTVQPNHYTSDTGRVVMVLTYDSEE